MNSPYQTPQGVKSYLEFINSPDGRIFQATLSEIILNRLSPQTTQTILDAGCGNGWLSHLLATYGYTVVGSDLSSELVNLASQNYPKEHFLTIDLNTPLPFPAKHFDTGIFNVSLLDLKNLSATAQEMHRVIGKKVLVISVNPYYGFPIGEWKRSVWQKIFRRHPHLTLNPYVPWVLKSNRQFHWANNRLTSYFYTLPEQITAFTTAGFTLSHIQDIYLPNPVHDYNLAFRLNQFPIFILFEFTL